MRKKWARGAACEHGTCAPDAKALVKVKYCSPGCMEQAPSRGHEASPQSGRGAALKCGLKIYNPSSKKHRHWAPPAPPFKRSSRALGVSLVRPSVRRWPSAHASHAKGPGGIFLPGPVLFTMWDVGSSRSGFGFGVLYIYVFLGVASSQCALPSTRSWGTPLVFELFSRFLPPHCPFTSSWRPGRAAGATPPPGRPAWAPPASGRSPRGPEGSCWRCRGGG